MISTIINPTICSRTSFTIRTSLHKVAPKQTSVDVKQCDKNNELLDMDIESDTTEEVGGHF